MEDIHSIFSSNTSVCAKLCVRDTERNLFCPGYTARVEFALKLGYTEKLVQAALQKLGPDPGQNELLAELIKLGATCSPRLSDSPEEPDGLLDTEMGTDEGGGSILSSTTAMTMNTTSSAGLRPVVIDGSNVAMSHGNKEVFSCRGIKICVDWFRARGHKEITVFVPKWRKEASRPDNPVADQEILGELERDRLLVFTPSRLVLGRDLFQFGETPPWKSLGCTQVLNDKKAPALSMTSSFQICSSVCEH